jgi:hypothetical protein
MDDDELSQSLSDLSASISTCDISLSRSFLDEMEAKNKIAHYVEENPNDMTKPILHSFVDHLPPDGRRVLSTYIAGSGPEALRELGNHLTKAILSPSLSSLCISLVPIAFANIFDSIVRACGGKAPMASPSPFGDPDLMAGAMVDTCSRNPLKKLKKLCLERDNYRCIVSGRYAMEAEGNFHDLSDNEIRRQTVRTDISHIIPFTLGYWRTTMTLVSAFRYSLQLVTEYLTSRRKATHGQHSSRCFRAWRA